MGEGMGRKAAEGRERLGKGDGRLDLDICPLAPEFLVTPLAKLVYKQNWQTQR